MEGKRTGRSSRLGLLVSILVAGTLAPAPNLAANTPLVVNRDGDAHDVNSGDGVCEIFPGSGLCTLRAAIEEAEALPGADVITFDPDLPNPTTFLLTLGHLEISTDLTITGNGSSNTIIDGNGSVTSDRVFLLTNATSTFTVAISGVTIQNGSTALGGGGGIDLIRIDAHLSLSGVVLTNNTAATGAGMFLTGLGTTLDHCTVSGNAATSVGGGMYINGPITVTASTIVGNSAARGGGLYDTGAARLVDSTVTGNSSTLDGGGIDIDGGTLDLVDATVDGNHSSQNGAGVYVGGVTSHLRANNATITNNSCNLTFTGCGIYVATGGDSSITNTVLAQNYQGHKLTYVADDCNAVTSNDYNLIQTASGCTITGATSNNIYNTDPKLGTLQDNGGPTQTVALLAGSPAIDAGNPSRCSANFIFMLTADQRGSVRPINGRCDMGAFEYTPPLQFYTLKPCRVVDTRNADMPALAAGSDRQFTLVGKCLIPSSATAVSLNVTVASPTSLGDLRVYPAGTPEPPGSTINFAKGQTRANDAVTSLSASGAVAIHDDEAVGNSVQVILDVNGYFQ